MKKFLLPHSSKNNPEYWLNIKQRIEGLLSNENAQEKLQDFVLEMITKNGVPEVIMIHETILMQSIKVLKKNLIDC